MFLLVIVVVVYKNEQVIFAALLPADYCQRGLPFTSSGGRTESVWKHDIRLGCKALRLKAKDADQIDYCQLGKMAVKVASTTDKALTDPPYTLYKEPMAPPHSPGSGRSTQTKHSPAFKRNRDARVPTAPPPPFRSAPYVRIRCASADTFACSGEPLWEGCSTCAMCLEPISAFMERVE